VSDREAQQSGSVLRVAVVEDQPLYRSMLVALLESQPDVRVLAVASGASEARAAVTPGLVDVAILDVELGDGNGIGLGVSLRRADAALGIVLLSSHDVMSLLLDLPPDMTRGWSYLSKNSSTAISTLMHALRATAAGGTVLDPELVQKATPRSGSAISGLSPRQYQVLQLLAEGLSNSGIAERLELSTRSVENHLNAIYATLNIEANSTRNPRVAAVLQFIEESARV
jgi:DNA-binding NarL/FixJ family response regulator